MRTIGRSKAFKGFTEGGFVSSLTVLAVDGLVAWLPWFESREAHLYVIVGSLVGGLVHATLSRYLWKDSNG